MYRKNKFIETESRLVALWDRGWEEGLMVSFQF